MKRAELILTMGGWSGTPVAHMVGFETAEKAKSEFDRIAALLKKRADRGNDVPRFLDVEGGTSELSCQFDQIMAVSLVDLRKADEELIGIKDEYPHIRWKS